MEDNGLNDFDYNHLSTYNLARNILVTGSSDGIVEKCSSEIFPSCISNELEHLLEHIQVPLELNFRGQNHHLMVA